MSLNNRGQFFSLITIIMIIPLVALSASFTQTLSGYGEELGSLVRLKSAYYFYNSVDKDLLRAGEIIGKRATVAALNWVIEEGEGLPSAEGAMHELFLNGSINGSSRKIMERSTIYHWLNTTMDISRKRGYKLDLDFLDFDGEDVGMENSYEIEFDLNYSLELKDRRGVFSLKRNISKQASIPIEDLEDPLITLRTGGKLVYTVDKKSYSHFARKLIAQGRGNNSWAMGKSLVLAAQTPINVDNPGEKILVMNHSVNQDVMNNFAGVVIKDDVDMSGFDRPYVVNVPNITVVQNETRVVVEGNESNVWEIQNLYSTWKNSYYVSGDGPSFLDRLENNLTNSYPGRGLSVFLKKKDLSDAGLEVKDKSNLAHIYFSDEPAENYKVKGMPKSFRIDKDHLEAFGLDNSLSYR